MKKWIVLFAAAISLSAFANDGEEQIEVKSLSEIQEPFIVESLGGKCPERTERVAKYCWSWESHCFVKCGTVCRPMSDGRHEIPPKDNGGGRERGSH